jgi:hypothetical protein
MNAGPRYAGLGGLKNGKLLAAAEAAGFDILLTVDRGFRYEQNFMGRKIAFIVLSTKSIALKDLLPHVPECLALLPTMKPGTIAKVPANPV